MTPTGLLDLVTLPPATWQGRLADWLSFNGPLLRFALCTVLAYYLLTR